MCVYTHPYTHAMHDLYAHLTIRYIHYNAHTHITAYKYDAIYNSAPPRMMSHQHSHQASYSITSFEMRLWNTFAFTTLVRRSAGFLADLI